MKNIQKFLVLNAGLFLVAILLTIFGGSLFGDIHSPTATVTPSITPTYLPSFKAAFKQPSFCYNGPSESYQIAAPVRADTVVDLLGANSDDENWFLIQGDNDIGRCWIKADSLNYNFDPNLLIILPTAFTRTDSACRIDFDLSLREETMIPKGWRIVINGKNSLKADWVLVTPHDSTTQCWVLRYLLTDFDYSMVPVVDSPEWLLITPTITGGSNTNQPNQSVATSTRRVNHAESTSIPAADLSPTSIPPTNPPSATLVPPTNAPPLTATLCWPPGKCK